MAVAAAQEHEELNTDRDAFTPATRTVERGRVLNEMSYVHIDNRGTPDTNSLPELLVRWGAFERLELRFGFNYEAGSGGSVVTPVEGDEGLAGDRIEKESSFLYGLKLWVTDQEGWVPRSSVIVEAFTPVSGELFGTEPAATYAFGWEFFDEWRFDTAIRYVYSDSEEGFFNKWNPSLVLRAPVTSRWELHAEYFCTSTDGLEDNKVRPFIGPGTHFVITPRFEVGVRMGWGLTQDAANYFVDTGMAVRF